MLQVLLWCLFTQPWCAWDGLHTQLLGMGWVGMGWVGMVIPRCGSAHSMVEPGAAFGPAGTKAAVRCSGLGHVGHCPLYVLWQRERFISPLVVPGAPRGEISLYLLVPHKQGHANPRSCCTLQIGFALLASLAFGAGSSGDTGDAPGWELL